MSRFVWSCLLVLISYSFIISVSAFPVITTHPNDNGNITVAEGSDVVLRCSANSTSDGKLSYQWRRVPGSLPSNTRVRNNGNLDIFKITVSDSGQYYCVVNDKEGNVTSMRVLVTARRRPSVSRVSDGQVLSIVSGNEKVMLTCNVNGDDITGGYWERVNDGPLPNNINNTSSLSNDKRRLTITIRRARPTHSGMYRCVVYSQWGVAQSRNVQVTITIAASTMTRATRQPTNERITALQQVTFTCTAKGYEVQYEWRHHKNNSIIGTGPTYSISRATPLDDGQYYCVAMTEGGYAFSNNVTLRVDGDISISQHPRSVTRAMGSMLTLSVTAGGPGKFTYQWKKRDGSLPSKASGGTTRSLKIRSVTSSDSGSYYCVVMNQWGSMTESNDAIVTVWPLPVISRHPNENGTITVAEGSNVMLRCEATGDGTLNYQWRRVSGSLPSNVGMSNGGQTLTIHRIAVSDSGQYYCEVNNGGDNVSSIRVQVTARRRPSVSGVSDDEVLSIVSGNEEVMLTCNVNGDDITGGYWERVDGSQQNNMSSLSNNKRMLTITISKARPAHKGRYRCVVYSQWGVAESRNVQVTITIAPPSMTRVTRQPTGQRITALQQVTFTCTAKGYEVQYEWRHHKNNTIIGTGSTYTISRATPLDEGRYYCVAMTEGGYAFSNNVTLRVDDELSISITSTPKPVISEGRSIQFIARATGITNKKKLMYHWQKNGRRNKLPDSALVINKTLLIIPTLMKADEGKYHCTVTNEWGNTEMSNVIKLTVIAGLPYFLRNPSDQIIDNYQTATFECVVNGSNTINVKWEKDEKPFSSRDKNVTTYITDNGVTSNLILDIASVDDSGKYRCNATNADGKSDVSMDAELIILPQIVTNPSSTIVLIGQSTQLNCTALGTNLGYQWIMDDLVEPDANSNTLEITNITESDEGAYKCVASNKGGPGRVESNSAIVTVYGPPIVHLPQQLHVVLGEQLQITCAATNDQDAPMNLIFSWKGPNGVQFNVTTTDEDDSRKATSTLHIKAVTRNHNGVYMCIVTNGEDQRNANSVKSAVFIEEPSSPPINFSIAYINPTSFQLKWSSPRYSNGSIDYYTVYYKDNDHDQSEQAVNVTNFNGTYTLDGLTPYTEYSVYVTAVRLIGNTGRPLEGMKSKLLTTRTLAGKPEVTTDNINQTMSEIIIINLNSSMTSGGRTFDIDLPQISMNNGPFSHFYIIVVINSSEIDVTAQTTHDLIEHSMNSPMLFYIAAVVNASQYLQYSDNFRMRYALGAGDNTIDFYGHMFHNREVKREYSFFYRVFSANSTRENEIYTNTEIKSVVSSQQSSVDSSSSSNAVGPVVGVIVALLLIVVVIVIVILLLVYYKKKYSKQEEAGLSKVVPTDAGVQLNNKEMKDVDAKPLSPVAATNPFPQETSFSPNSPLPMEITTSVGQPTTLFVELPYADDSEITWQKDGKSLSHPVLPDGSLYIAHTKLSNQGDYTVTATATDNTTSEILKLIVIDPKMPTTLSDHKPVKVEDFPEHIALMQSKKNIQFEEEYESVMVDVALSQHAAKLHVNASKNRYKNIVPYDHCRVLLTQQGQRPGSEYVNASFVDGYKEPRAYIASQGPVGNTVDDFWRMIWEHNVTTIVMLTRLIEDSKIKCHQYWPETESAMYGNFKVTITKHEVIAKYCIRKFIIEKTSDHKSREVCLFHFTAWPDHGVPKYGTDILEFQKRIDKYHKRKDNKPMVVHCSAGVGRTGTFIAIDIEIQRINQESLVDVYNCVCRLRFWRNFMVQTVDQYTLIFTALLEHIACGDTSIAAPTKSVQDKVKELSSVDPNTKKTGFETQFETLTKNSPKEKEFTHSVASKNKSKNRNKKCLPPDANRVHLSKVGDKSDYINACYIDGYRHCKEFLVGPGPMESTSADFWRMIWENKSHAIVMLGQLNENGEEASFQYWPNKDDNCEFDNLTVQTTTEDPVDNNVTKRVMKITHKETSATRTITQLQYVEWPQNSTPSNPNSIIDLIEILERVQRKTANGPITVHCSDGMGRSGTFCALVVSINRFKAEQMVDVFKTIITMRTQRPGLVTNAEQYKFIHEVIINMLLRFATYSNFSDDNITNDGVYENLPSSSM